jgi:serine/threonine-protein kinase ATR
MDDAAIDIRTYAVMPLNEECGMLEWVPNTLPLRNIVMKGYERRDVKTYVRFHICSGAIGKD